MNHPRIKLGVDDRFLAFVLALLLIGCVGQPGQKARDNKPSSSLEQIAYESFQKRDALRSEKLMAVADRIKSGELKYDGPIQKAIEEAGAQASQETWKPVAEKLQQLLGGGEKLDAAKAEQAVRDIARGAARASK
jgi:hypothetical protein